MGETVTYYLPSAVDSDSLDILFQTVSFAGDFPEFATVSVNQIIFAPKL